jgi:2-oxoglutarate dehydrogenase E1 component
MKRENGEPSALNLAFVEGLFEDFLRDPESVPADWRRYFESRPHDGPFEHRTRLGPTFRPSSLFDPGGNGGAAARASGRPTDVAVLQDRVDQLIRAYRVRAHLVARLDPLGTPRPSQPELDPGFYGLTEADLDRTVSTRTIKGPETQTLRQILRRLKNTYCRSIGVQFMHIDELSVKNWLQERMEVTENRLGLSSGEKLQILTKLTDAVIFEEFIQKKYLGGKSFSLEGSESLIPLLDLAIEKAGDQGIDEIVFGMAHRGRLNVLANIMDKKPRLIFREFEDKDAEEFLGRGDVKYHLGFQSARETASGRTVRLTLCFNPSHLEFVNPVVQGRVRALQDQEGDAERSRRMGLLIHGDASFAGEGIVQESLNLSQLGAYATGGTLHVILNNQIGFTTYPQEGRSSTYASDVAKMLQIPIFHVNGEDPEAVAQVVRLAMEFRRTFRRDVVIDMYGYRRRGHNEGDEPTFTHPTMYRRIEKRPSVREGYLEHLVRLGGVTPREVDEIALRRRQQLEEELSAAREDEPPEPARQPEGRWHDFEGGRLNEEPDLETGYPRERLAELLRRQTELPEGFRPNPKIEKGLEQRRRMAAGEKPLDWGAAESLAYATLAVEGHRVRLTGQDSARGTFSHRHAELHDYETGQVYVPLANLSAQQAPVEIRNSPLSEAGVLGFEYGYSLDCPDGLVLWEAQYGDFSNAAQVAIDQFITSGEDKWEQLSGLVLLLPHGFEGAGPEHSSARLERFLLLAAEDNIQVVNPTTPAQFFHVLRRQVHDRHRKPLVVMTPKSLLRHPRVVSDLDDLGRGRFRRVLPDTLSEDEAKKVRRVLLCSGKIYYDLLKRREDSGRRDVALLRLEQLYPFPVKGLRRVLEAYPETTPAVWVQEEPENMGAWRYLRARCGGRLLRRNPLSGVSRPESASPATRSASSHKLEQAMLLEEAFGEGESES